MASYLRPRRGKRATAESQAIVLKRGEVFFECPDTGVGTGKGKIKVGDGSTKYASLPYYMENYDANANDATIAFTDTSAATAYSNNSTYLTNIKPANSLKTIFTNLKQLLFNYNAQLTELNNDVSILTGLSGVSHNGTFRGKNLGTISTLNEYIAFRNAHGINDKSYKDLYLGDYFTVNDGTYNTVWMVAHFDYFYNKGPGNATEEHPEYTLGARGVLLIPRTYMASGSQMNTENTTVGGYKACLANTTHCPAIAASLQTVFGSYLLNMPALITNNMNASTASIAGAGLTGATSGWEWSKHMCILPNELQVYGAGAFSSSFYEYGEACEKLAVFNFINHVEYSRTDFWLRSVASASYFAFAHDYGRANYGGASNSFALRPLIYIG